MKIGFDARYAEGDLVGIGKYIRLLIMELSKRGVDCVLFYSKKPKFKIEGKNIKSVVIPSANRYFFEQIGLPIALRKEKVDLYHALGNVGIPLSCSVPAILTVHDIIPLEIKGYFSYSPLPIVSKTSYLSRLKTSLSKASKIVTVSNFVKNELIKKLKIKSDKITTIYSGASELGGVGKLPKNLIGQKYILNHGGIDIRKNLDALIKAFDLFHQNHKDIKLVITGENKRIRKELNSLLQGTDLFNSVIFTGYVDDETLHAIIKNAELICYPTLSEGFGFPILEGFGLGVPVVASNTSAIPEISGNAAILINPENVNEIADALEKVYTNKRLRKNMVSAGRREYNRFTWKKATDEYLHLYNSFK